MLATCFSTAPPETTSSVAMAEFDRYSDGELRLITAYVERGSELLLDLTTRVEQMRERRDNAVDRP